MDAFLGPQVVEDAGTTPFPSTRSCPADFTNAARTGDYASCLGIVRKKTLKIRIGRVVHALLNSLREDTGLNKNHVNMVRRWRTVVKAEVASSNTVVSEPATGALALAGVRKAEAKP